ncbi:MAG: NUDIX domain-containing protein [Pseudonocardiaceae bacterium]
MTMSVRQVGRRSARALLLDDEGHLVLIKRTKPGESPYWTTPGGGVEDGESSPGALERELGEELGARAAIGERVLLMSTPLDDSAVAVQEVFVARLLGMREADRTGAEWSDPTRGGYEVVRVPVAEAGGIDLKPDVLREFVTANVDALVNEAAVLA